MIEANAGTKPVAEQHAFDIAALERYLLSPPRRVPRPAERRAVQRRPVQSHLQADHTGPRLRHALEARPGGQAAAVGACHRSRVPGHERAARHRRARADDARPVRGRECHRSRVLCHGVHARARPLGPVAAGPRRAGARAHLRRDESRDRRAPFGRSSAGSASKATASRATTSSARSAAGPSSTSRRSPNRSKRWTG
jgi:hypothetical protein